MNSASFLTLWRSWSATCRHWARAASASFWAKAVPMKAETTRRPCLPAWASALRMKWMRQRCQEAFKTLGDSCLQPLVGVGNHQLDAAQAAPGEGAQEAGPEGLGL